MRRHQLPDQPRCHAATDTFCALKGTPGRLCFPQCPDYASLLDGRSQVVLKDNYHHTHIWPGQPLDDFY